MTRQGQNCQRFLRMKVPFREICEPYSHLMRGIKEVKQSRSLQRLIALTLAVGNEMNRSNIKSFDLNSLLKLSSIKGRIGSNV